MNKGNPAVTAGAGALGVFVAMILTSGELGGSLIAAAVTGAIAYAILMYLRSRRG